MSLDRVGGILSVGLDGINSPVTQVEYLVVAGGGGGGNCTSTGGYSACGGGGAGGLLTATGYSVTLGSSITVTIGAGGSSPTSEGAGANGTNSVFGAITATGRSGFVHHASRITDAWRKALDRTVVPFFYSCNRDIDGLTSFCHNLKVLRRPFNDCAVKPTKLVGKRVTAA